MKYFTVRDANDTEVSHPVRGAWIEINETLTLGFSAGTSHPVRGAWIEILNDVNDTYSNVVASRKGCVD